MTSDSIYDIIRIMKDKGRLENPQNVLFSDLVKICERYFGKPRINLQRTDKMAKFYQVRDVRKAIEKLEAQKNEE